MVVKTWCLHRLKPDGSTKIISIPAESFWKGHIYGNQKSYDDDQQILSSGVLSKEQFRISVPGKIGSHPNIHQLGRNPTLVNRVSVGGKGEYVMLNDGDVISIALATGDPDAALPMYTVKVMEVAVPKPPAKAAAQKPPAKAASKKPPAKAAAQKPPAKAADPKPAKRQREVVRPAVSQDWPVDLREQEELHRLLHTQLKSLDETSDPLGLLAVVREKVRERYKALSSIIESRGSSYR